jgi:hypothetical protein
MWAEWFEVYEDNGRWWVLINAQRRLGPFLSERLAMIAVRNAH